MKKICIIALVSLWATLAVYGFCEANRQPAGKGTGSVADKAESRQARTAKGRGGNGFAGMVVGVDSADKTITVKGRGRTVTFDASNPVIKGGQKLEDFKSGSYVVVSYTADGTRIARSSKKEAGSEVIREAPQRAGKQGRARARVRSKGTAFEDVDENKDGKITPVELSVVIGSLTMKQFRDYDKNGDGCLSESEYRAVPK